MALSAFTACTPKQTKVLEEEKQQNELVVFLQRYYDRDKETGNSIQQDELITEREHRLAVFQDSIGVFHNIKGKIDRIRANDERGLKILEYDIVVQETSSFKLDLRCKYIIPRDSSKTDYLFNYIKSLSNSTEVYVDGAIAMDFSRHIDNYGGGRTVTTTILLPSCLSTHDKDLRFKNPIYIFNVSALSTDPLPDLSPKLLNAIKLWRKVLTDKIWKKHTKEVNENITAFKKASELLSMTENDYLSEYIKACTNDLPSK